MAASCSASATGALGPMTAVGGLAGYNGGTIGASHATGAITGLSGSVDVGGLGGKGALLGGNVRGEAAVTIQVIGGEIGDHRHMRRPPDSGRVFQHETRKFQHHQVQGTYIVAVLNQRLTDVAAKPYAAR